MFEAVIGRRTDIHPLSLVVVFLGRASSTPCRRLSRISRARWHSYTVHTQLDDRPRVGPRRRQSHSLLFFPLRLQRWASTWESISQTTRSQTGTR
jgi:hypothetical protein